MYDSLISSACSRCRASAAVVSITVVPRDHLLYPAQCAEGAILAGLYRRRGVGTSCADLIRKVTQRLLPLSQQARPVGLPTLVLRGIDTGGKVLLLAESD